MKAYDLVYGLVEESKKKGLKKGRQKVWSSERKKKRCELQIGKNNPKGCAEFKNLKTRFCREWKMRHRPDIGLAN